MKEEQWVRVFNVTFNNVSVISWRMRTTTTPEQWTGIKGFILKYYILSYILGGLSWSCGSRIYNFYLCNHCLSPLKLWDRILLMAGCIRYNIMWYEFVMQRLAQVLSFSMYSRFLHLWNWFHDKTEILLEVSLSTIIYYISNWLSN